MIKTDGGVFRLSTKNTSYWFRATKFGHLEHVYYGARLPDGQDPAPLALKRTAEIGGSVAYDKSDKLYCLDNLCLEWSGIGRGDFREPSAELKMPDGSFACDFVYEAHRVEASAAPSETLPCAYGGAETLVVTLADRSNAVFLDLYYTVFSDVNVIARRAVLRNENENPLVIRRLMSMTLDLPDRGFRLTTFDGGWIKEAQRHDRALQYGLYVNACATGASGPRHNPGFLLSSATTSESAGDAYGFNLVYSGNHYGFAELCAQDTVRVGLGINPRCFEWELKRGERFETPQAVLTYSDGGFNGLSHNFHDFINGHIVRGEYKNKDRPVLLNDWEACFFKFTEGKLLRLARQSKKLGAELFVLDDGWFKGRDSDTAGLGDYAVNRKKLPFGIAGLSKKIHRMGLKFGLWVEPEMVNADSELYRAHPDFAVTTPGKTPCEGRNQLVLDLCRAEVRDYIVDNVSRVLDEGGVDYVKWDMNRAMSDAFSPALARQGEFYHRYILGLYDVLARIFRPRPHILFESCASGGGRFDLGMLCFCQQIWTSDDTDPVERLKIQSGVSYLYPLSAVGAHVSAAPHQQTLRQTPLTSRFNAAAFGCLGFELDPKYLTRAEKRELKSAVDFYKRHRRTLQYGRFYRLDYPKGNKYIWQCVSDDASESVAGFFQTLANAAEGYDYLPLRGLSPEKKYTLRTRPQSLFIRRFGGLVKHILPVELDPDGFLLRTANKYFALTDCVEAYEGGGGALMRGVPLANQFMGSNYNGHTRLLGDFGSNLYEITQITDKGEDK